MNPGYAVIRIPKAGGGIRVLHVPCASLKAEQKNVLKVLRKFVLSFGPFVHGYARKRSIKTNAENLVLMRDGKYWAPTFLLKLDIKDFFSNVTDGLVLECLAKEQVPAWLWEGVRLKCFIDLNGKRVLPQGAPTSPFLSALVMKYVSIRLSGLLKQSPSWCPSRLSVYADNITFSSDAPMYGWIPKVRYVLGKFGLELREDKIRVSRKPGRQIICGVQINDKIGPPRAVWRNLRAELHNAWMDRMAGLVPSGYRLDQQTRRDIRFSAGTRGLSGVVKKKDLPHLARDFLKGKKIEPLPLSRWQGQISFVKSLDPAKGEQLEKLFQKVEDVCSRRGKTSSSARSLALPAS